MTAPALKSAPEPPPPFETSPAHAAKPRSCSVAVRWSQNQRIACDPRLLRDHQLDLHARDHAGGLATALHLFAAEHSIGDERVHAVAPGAMFVRFCVVPISSE
jgi:hypothetical protein